MAMMCNCVCHSDAEVLENIGGYCSSCGEHSGSVRDSEESAEKLLANASSEHIVTVVGMAATEEGSWFTESSYKKAVEYVSDWKEELLQAERTRIIKALKPWADEINEEISAEHDINLRDCEGFRLGVQFAIKAVGEDQGSESAANEG